MNSIPCGGNIRICALSGNHELRIVNVFFSDRNNAAFHATPGCQPRLIVDESDGVHGRVRAAASLCFVLAAQARKLSLSPSLGWAGEAQKRHARNSDGDAAIIKVLSFPLYFRSLRLVVVARSRSSWWQNWACDRHVFCSGATVGVRCAMI